MIDIIIPAYNCSKTLFRTLSSLECQTDDNFNVILVDDCSTEDITSIIKEKQFHINIKYIRKIKNEGCGMARQTGIDNSTSDYFTFLDSDDILMPYAVETFNEMINSSDFDVYHSYFYEQTIKDDSSALLLHKEGFTWCHGKLYKRSFIEKYNIVNLPDIKYADDSYFNSMCIDLGTIGVIPIAMYLWMNNGESITRRQNGVFHKNALSDFIYAMIKSTEHILQFKQLSEINYLQKTVKNIQHLYGDIYDFLSKEEQSKTDKLLNDFYKLIDYQGGDSQWVF